MEETRETLPEEESLSNQGEGGEFRELDEVTTQPEAVIERKVNIEVAEGIEEAFVNLMEQTIEDLESISVGEKEEEEGEYRVKVKLPWIGGGEEDDMETNWARVSALTTDERGAWFMPEITDTVILDSNEEIPRPADIQPLEEADEDGKLNQHKADGITYYKEGENGEDSSGEGGSEDESGNSKDE